MGTPLQVPPDQLVDLSAKGQVGLTGDALKEGAFIELTFDFASGQSTKVKVPVVPRSGDFVGRAAPAQPLPKTPPEPERHPTS